MTERQLTGFDKYLLEQMRLSGLSSVDAKAVLATAYKIPVGSVEDNVTALTRVVLHTHSNLKAADISRIKKVLAECQLKSAPNGYTPFFLEEPMTCELHHSYSDPCPLCLPADKRARHRTSWLVLYTDGKYGLFLKEDNADSWARSSGKTEKTRMRVSATGFNEITEVLEIEEPFK